MQLTPRHYARAILGLELSQREELHFEELLWALYRLYRSNPALRDFLLNPAIAASKKARWLATTTSELFENFILLLISNHDLGKMKPIIKELERLRESERGIVDAFVDVPTPLSAPLKKSLQRALEKRSEKKILMHEKVEPELIGGVRIKIGYEVIDGSIKGRLSQLKQSLLG